MAHNKSDLEDILLLRTIGDPAEARVHFDTWLKHHPNVSALIKRPSAFRDTEALSAKTFLYASLINMSFIRFTGNFEDACDVADALSVWSQNYDLQGDFHLVFQRGLNALTLGRSVEALKLFQSCVSEAPSAELRSACRFNLLIAAENIGAFFPDDLTLLEADLESVGSASVSMRAQCQSMRLRYDIYTSSVHLWTAEQWRKLDSGQAMFLAAWLEQMPHFKLTKDRTAAAQRLLLDNTAVFSSNYMLRTLTGAWAPEDRSRGVKLSDKLDRLYLWTWRWATEPTDEGWASLRQVLEDALDSLGEEPLHGFDLLLFKNSVLLLRILCPQLTDLDEVLEDLRGSTTGFDYFKTESRFLEIMLAFRDGQKQAANAMTEALFRELDGKDWTPLPLVALIRRTLDSERSDRLDPELTRLSDHLKSLTLEPTYSDDHIAIDLHRRTMTYCGSSTSDQRLIQLVTLFEHKKDQFTTNVMKRAFGRRDYDPTRDDRRLFRLLQAARDFCNGSIVFKKQQDKILCERNSSLQIHFIGSSGYGHSKLSARPSKDKTPLLPSIEFADELTERWWTRVELEAWTALPKASLLRRINEWRKAGLIEIKGTGKSTRYQLSKDLVLQRAASRVV